MKKLFVALTAGLLASVTSRAAHAVEGGVEDRATTHAVAITVGGPTAPDVRCSGTLISPNVVVTVRHCFAPLTTSACDGSFGPPASTPTDYWVDPSVRSGSGTSAKRVKSWAMPVLVEACGSDIAVLVLDAPFAAGEATPAVPIVTEQAFAKAIGARALGISGFGSTGPDATDRGTRRTLLGIPITCVPGQAAFPCGPARDFIDATEFAAGGGPCAGDSGAGAMLFGDNNTIFGVLARGKVDGGRCSEGVFERTDIWSWLIARSVLDAASAAGLNPPAWASELFPSAARAGEYCRDDASCADNGACVSTDEGRSFRCAVRCGGEKTCASGTHCVNAVCVPGSDAPEESSSCVIARATSSSLWWALLPMAVLGFCRRRQSGSLRSSSTRFFGPS